VGSYLISSVNQVPSGLPVSSWFNLYPVDPSDPTCAWDYYTRVPSLSCNGGFAFHTGSISHGCVTVLKDACMQQLLAAISMGPHNAQSIKECRTCLFGKCWGGTKKISSVSYMATMIST